MTQASSGSGPVLTRCCGAAGVEHNKRKPSPALDAALHDSMRDDVKPGNKSNCDQIMINLEGILGVKRPLSPCSMGRRSHC